MQAFRKWRTGEYRVTHRIMTGHISAGMCEREPGELIHDGDDVLVTVRAGRKGPLKSTAFISFAVVAMKKFGLHREQMRHLEVTRRTSSTE